MKNIFIFVVAAVIFSANFVCAGEKEVANGYKSFTEISVGVHNRFLDEIAGQNWFNKPVSNQSVMVGMDKAGSGFYFKPINYVSLNGQETGETDTYVGMYKEVEGSMQYDIGCALYHLQKKSELDYHAVYMTLDSPKTFWQVVSFVKMEYRFAKKFVAEDGSRTDMNGFVYLGGFKREFVLGERVTFASEVSVGGNTGIYGMSAESLAYAREKVEAKITLTEQWKLNVSVLTQQNLGKKDGIAADTDKLFMSAAITGTF